MNEGEYRPISKFSPILTLKLVAMATCLAQKRVGFPIYDKIPYRVVKISLISVQ